MKKTAVILVCFTASLCPAWAQEIDPDMVPPDAVLSMQGMPAAPAATPAAASAQPPGFPGYPPIGATQGKFTEPRSFMPEGWPFDGSYTPAGSNWPQNPMMSGRMALMQQALQQRGMITPPGQAPSTGAPPAAGSMAAPHQNYTPPPVTSSAPTPPPDASSAGPSPPSKKGCPNCHKKKGKNGESASGDGTDSSESGESADSQSQSPQQMAAQPPATPAAQTQSARRGDPVAVLQTTKGVIAIRLFSEHAPKTVANFVDLIQKGFYNGLTWHRVVPGFVIQAGCPKGDGTGGYIDPATGQKRQINIELSQVLRHNAPGVVSMARFGSDMNSASTQFFITQSAQPRLDNKYAVFGGVISGMDVVQQITPQDKILSATLQ